MFFGGGGAFGRAGGSAQDGPRRRSAICWACPARTTAVAGFARSWRMACKQPSMFAVLALRGVAGPDGGLVQKY